MRTLALILCFLMIGAVAEAQGPAPQRAGYNGFSLTTPLEVSVGYDRNFLVDRVTPEQKLFFLSFSPTFQRETPLSLPKKYDDQVLLLTAPTASFISDSQRRQLAFSYRPEIEIFQTYRDQNSWNHDAMVSYSYSIKRKVNISVGDKYRSSNDPSRTLQNIFLLLPRSRYQENAFRIQLLLAKSQATTFTVRFDNTATKFGNIDPFQVRMLDSIANSISFGATHLLNQKQRVRGTYSLYKVSPIDGAGVADEGVDIDRPGMRIPSHLFTGEYRVNVNSSTVLEFLGGFMNGESGTNYVFRVSGDRRLGNIWVSGSYSRSVSFFAGDTRQVANGLKSNDLFDIVSFRVRGEPFRRIAISGGVMVSQGASDAILDRSKALMGRARIDYRWTDRITAFFNAETYQQNRNSFVNAALSRNRFFAGIQYSFASEEERRINRLNRDAEYVSLTEQGAFRRSRQ